jgi:death-on-curing protein
VKEPLWITRLIADAIHADLVAQHGGLLGVRDENVLESALARPRNRWAHDESADIPALSAAYAFGVVQNHPFNDGNKRTAFMLAYVFLGTNGLNLEATEEEVVTTMVDLADHRLTEDEFAAWLRTHTTRAG